MIIIKSGEDTIYHPKHPGLLLVNPKLTLEDNAAGSLTFKVYDTNSNYSRINRLFPLITVLRNGKTIFKGRVIADKKDFYNGRTVEAEGKLAFFNDSFLEPFSFQGSPEELFRMIIDRHNAEVMPWQQFKVGMVTVKDNNDYIVRSSEAVENTWEALKEKCFKSSLGGHLRIRYEEDGDYVDWLEDYDKTSSQGIAFARNMISMSMETDASETYTAIRPVGAESEGVKLDISSVNEGRTYLVNEKKAEEYGIIFAPESESTWSDVTLPENLLKKAREKLYGSMAALSEAYEIRAVDLNLTDDAVEALDICEYVPVSSKPHGIEGRYLLTKAEIVIASPQDSIYYLGASRRVLQDISFGGSAKQDAVPQKISELVNDEGYISQEKASQMMEEYTRPEDVETIVKEAVPNKVSSLENDEGYLSEEGIREILTEYLTAEEVKEILAGHPTEEEVRELLEGHPSAEDVEDIVSRAVEELQGVKDGRDGLSAYELAVAEGFSGTVEEWLASLNGRDGKDGESGSDGFSPQITENAGNNADTYKLDITTAKGSFTTPNLKGASADGGACLEEIRGLFGSAQFKVEGGAIYWKEQGADAWSPFKGGGSSTGTGASGVAAASSIQYAVQYPIELLGAEGVAFPRAYRTAAEKYVVVDG